MFDDLSINLSQYGLFLRYFLTGSLMVIMFGLIYSAITPIKEFQLIKSGNSAASLSFGGAIIGFSLSISGSISNADNFSSFLIWAFFATLIQLTIFGILSILIKNAAQKIRDNNIAVGLFFAITAISMGLINMASQS